MSRIESAPESASVAWELAPSQTSADTYASARRLPIVLPIGIGLTILVVFSPALWFGFVEWDDFANFVANFDFRGLTLTHVHWMLTSIRGGHWIPATWATFALDHAVWGMDPFGYHLTNILLHCANAIAFFFLGKRLLRLAMRQRSAAAVQVGAAAAALFFGLHPLRVESVVWITERRDVLSALFWLLAILAYLRAPERSSGKRGSWKLLSLVCYQLAVMAKSITVTLPVVLLVLDAYPLRRYGRNNRRLLAEKAPYLLIMVFGMFMAFFAAQRGGYLSSLDRLSFTERIAVTAYSAWFYVSTTAAPLTLSPLYELPPSMNAMAWRFVAPLLAVTAISGTLLVFRRQWPGVLAAWIVYLVTLSPVSGIVHNGPQLVADRYSYLSCLPWALLFGALVAALVPRLSGSGISAWRTVAVACLVVLAALPVLTRRQLPVWRDGESLWQYTLAVDPDCSMCHYYFGQYLRNRDKPALAVEHFSRAAELRPALNSLALYHVNRGLAYFAAGQLAAAAEDLAAVRSISATLADQTAPAFIAEW
jgi:protein O-mannosyl-transferase